MCSICGRKLEKELVLSDLYPETTSISHEDALNMLVELREKLQQDREFEQEIDELNEEINDLNTEIDRLLKQ